MSCSSTKSVTTKSVNQKYYNLNFRPSSISDKKINNTILTVTPVDAKSLNKDTYEAAIRDGNYEKEFISIIETWKTKLSSMSRRDRIYTQGKINAFEALDKLTNNGVVPSYLSILLKQRIINEDKGRDGTEVESLEGLEIFPSEFNPYKVNSNYFSVFKLTFENKGQSVENINIKEFQIVSNEEQLYPLGSEYFEKNLHNRSETVKNSFRMNMPDELLVTPGQRISKYIAVPAINTDNSTLQVQYIRDGNVTNFDFNISKQESEKTFKFEKYVLVNKGKETKTALEFYYVIKYKDNISYSLKSNQLFVNDEKRKLPADIYAVGINLLNSKILFGSSKDFIFSNEKANKKNIEFKSVK
jgi:hypothetical protein